MNYINITLIFVAIFVLLILYVVMLYNGLVTKKVRVNEAWSGIDVQLKRRTDLIPNLVETVKGYATHEKEVFEKVTQARAALMDAKTTQQAGQANDMLTGALKSLFAVAEAYPDLKASQGFTNLQSELSDTETKIAFSRQFYNSVVREFNQSIVTFPQNIFAKALNFNSVAFFEAAEADKEPVKVSFS